MELPKHTGREHDDTAVQSSRSRKTTLVVVIAIVAILATMVLLHVTGVIHGH